MTNFFCGGSQLIQSQQVCTVDELSAALQSEAKLDRLSADVIAEQVAFQSLSGEQLQKIAEAQLCEVPDYKVIPMTTRELGLVQSGCRYQDIDAAVITLSRRLNPNYVEQEPAPAVPVQKDVSERLVAEKNNPFENINFEVSEAAAAPLAALALLAATRTDLQQLLEDRKLSATQVFDALKYFQNSIAYNLGAIRGYLAQGREYPAEVAVALNNTAWVLAVQTRVQDLLNASRAGAKIDRAQLEALRVLVANMNQAVQEMKDVFITARPERLLASLQNIIAGLAAQAPAARSVIVDMAGNPVNLQTAAQATRAVAPVLEVVAAEVGSGVGEIKIIIDEEFMRAERASAEAAQRVYAQKSAVPSVLTRAQAAPAVQSLRSASLSGGPYTRPLLLVAGAAVLIGAGYYWLRDE